MTRAQPTTIGTNLAKKFLRKGHWQVEGTRLGRQELMAELLDDRPGALWTLKAIDADRVSEVRAHSHCRAPIQPSPAATIRRMGVLVVGIGLNPMASPGRPTSM